MNASTAPKKRTTKAEKNTMAKNTATATAPTTPATTPDPEAQLKAAVKEVKGRFPDHPKRAIELIAAATLRKLTKDEIGELRTFKLKKDGTPIVVHDGPRERSAVNMLSVANVIEFAGIPGLKKMHERHGNDMRKPLAQYVKSLTEGSDDRNAMEALQREFFPSQRKGFTKSETQKVSKQGRVAILVNDAGIAAGSEVKREVIEHNGVRGVFVYAAPVAAQVPAQAAPVAPVFMAAAAAPQA